MVKQSYRKMRKITIKSSKRIIKGGKRKINSKKISIKKNRITKKRVRVRKSKRKRKRKSKRQIKMTGGTQSLKYNATEDVGIQLPIRWMSEYAVYDHIFNNKTDIYSYLCTMYEIFNKGMQPPCFTEVVPREKYVDMSLNCGQERMHIDSIKAIFEYNIPEKLHGIFIKLLPTYNHKTGIYNSFQENPLSDEYSKMDLLN